MQSDYQFEEQPKVPLHKLIDATNICDLLKDDQVEAIGMAARQGYFDDLASRNDWEIRMAGAMDLALQVMREKSEPWQGCSNVKFPLITVGALQHHSRAFPTLISGTDPVQARVIGGDKDGQKTKRAERISTHMSWQCLEQDETWEAEHDKALLVQPIVGCAFIKTSWSNQKRKMDSKLVLPKNLVLNYYTKDLEHQNTRFTHDYNLGKNLIVQRQIDGRYRKFELTEKVSPTTTNDQGPLQESQDLRQGLTKPADDVKITPYFTGEQYCWIDLDGDGMDEPYIVTFDIASGVVYRIAPRFIDSGVRDLRGASFSDPKFDGKPYYIEAVPVFTKIPFIPSPDGGYYDLGLGMLLGPLTDSVNTALNQMFDACSMLTMGGGFVGRGFKSKGGPFTFKPNQWHPTDAPGDDLRKNILPLPKNEPPQVLMSLVQFLVGYAERIISASETQMGVGQGQNQKAETTRILNDNGDRVYSAIFKRTWMAFRNEYRVRYKLNQLFFGMDADYDELTQGADAMIFPKDYLGSKVTVVPAADPHVVSDHQREQQALNTMNMALKGVPNMNRYLSVKRYLEVIHTPDIDAIFPPPMEKGEGGQMKPAKDLPPPPNVKMEELKIKAQHLELDKKEMEFEQKVTAFELKESMRKLDAEIEKMEAQAKKFLAEATGVDQGHMLGLINAAIAVQKETRASSLKLLDQITKSLEKANAERPADAGVGGVEKSPADAGVSQAAS